VSVRIQLIRALLYGATGSAVIGLILFIAQFVFGVSETFHFVVDQVLPFFLGKELVTLVASYPSLLVNINGETILRLSTFFPDPHVAAYFYGMCGFLALGMARLVGRTQYQYIWMAGILFFADLLTFSRGGYIGLLVGIGVYGFLIVPKLTSSSRLWAGGFILFCFLALLMFGQPVLSRLAATFSLADTSSLERISLWRESFDAIAHRPLFGVGLGNYIATVRPLYAVGTPFYAHNLYLDISLEMGLLGLIAFLGICLYALSCVLKLRHRDPLAPALLGVFALYLTHSLFETTLYSLHITLVFSFVVALALSSRQPVFRITQ
jgi:O-antigen ligase